MTCRMSATSYINQNYMYVVSFFLLFFLFGDTILVYCLKHINKKDTNILNILIIDYTHDILSCLDFTNNNQY